VEAVPRIALQACQDNVSYDRAHAKRLARKADVERVPHEAAAAIRAGQ
jgi:hypothetical protein